MGFLATKTVEESFEIDELILIIESVESDYWLYAFRFWDRRRKYKIDQLGLGDLNKLISLEQLIGAMKMGGIQ